MRIMSGTGVMGYCVCVWFFFFLFFFEGRFILGKSCVFAMLHPVLLLLSCIASVLSANCRLKDAVATLYKAENRCKQR